ncbi:uncharacterized protein PADG_00831 [Paracoccidioides brasiliensis Pb18]|uniref:Mid2 domain-containing protein n=1 Tax=Paracoccidioides brasiliensis (strain Pb18) TaxID=502780 RepID=C1FYF5_PARBD|nr:uncharacterized protein PADG_00831 [Paracoccidioides brasiliensis Pb18]EEH44542.1 hypothetical protein PADG_00831 [Paracoccidioides brasiliensis Pb18]ODH49487.1 hypothetical protein GX48_04429 [Paracoccidioides brasiliensis]
MRWTSASSLLLLLVLLLAIAVANAGPDALFGGFGYGYPNVKVRKRQLASDDNSAQATESPTQRQPPAQTSPTTSEQPPPPPESTPDPTSEPRTTPPSSTSRTQPQSSSTPPDTPTPTADSTTPTQDQQKPTETNNVPSTTNSPSVVIVTNTVTISGTPVQQTSASTVAPGQTLAPGLGNNAGGPGGSSGVGTPPKNVIIGVVVGVGGSITLAGLAFVVWRLHTRRSFRGPGDEDDLMNAGTAVGTSSLETSGTSSSPFKSTLDQYHHPGGLNASSNF